jgi:dnd system-associated protein 4
LAKTVSIHRSKVYEPIVQALSGERAFIFNESGKKAFSTIRDLLTFCAMLGFKNNCRIPLDRSNGTEDIQGVVYEDTEALEFIWLLAITTTQDIEILQDGNEKLSSQIYEEYANGGLSIISEKLTSLSNDQWPQAFFEFCLSKN